MSKRVPKRWLVTKKQQRWETREGGKWVKDTSRKSPKMTNEALIKVWIRIASSDDPAVSRIGRHFGKSNKVVKTARTRINTEYKAITKIPVDPLTSIPDFTHKERAAIEKETQKKTVVSIFENLPKDLKEKMQKLLAPPSKS